MYWTDVGSWQTLASRSFSSTGSYTFRVRRLASGCYATSAQSSLYTLTVNLMSQAAVSSANGSISQGGSFTPSTSGGTTGTWQMYWTDVGSWQTLASRSFSSAGSYTFRVRRLASGCYATSAQSSLYTLTVLYPAGTVTIGTSGATTSLWGTDAIYETQSINVTYSWTNMANISVKTGGWTDWRTSTATNGSSSGVNNWFSDGYVDTANTNAGNPVSRNYWFNDTRISGTDLNGNAVSATGGFYILDEDY